ncbi:MAG: 23S rRNA (uracil(1939)-C(5))-methyltransferase RlmD [Desulfobacterales bacterium]|nr:23S rRNA (uracil(1939)-C(5))-methyltransferase RlmD [Desulfobacterales bacterium]
MVNYSKSDFFTIKKVINGGYGLSSLKAGKTVLVKYALPGETVCTMPLEQKKRLEYAQVTETIESHPRRITAPCSYYTKCGGCDLQHADYVFQCTIKQQIIADLLFRQPSMILKELSADIPLTISAPLQFGYRQRIRLKIINGGRFGFNKFHSHDVIAINKCLLAPPIINDCLSALPESGEYLSLAPILEELEILHNPYTESLNLLLHLNRRPRAADQKNAACLGKKIKTLSGVFFSGNGFSMQGPFGHHNRSASRRMSTILQADRPLTLSWEVGGFCQVNMKQNERLVELVLRFSALAPSDRVLDLYSGMGNFALPVALRAAHVHGIENQGSAIRSACFNSSQNNIANTTFEKSDVIESCKRLINRKATFDVIICDPPRQGMPALAPLLGLLTK